MVVCPVNEEGYLIVIAMNSGNTKDFFNCLFLVKGFNFRFNKDILAWGVVIESCIDVKFVRNSSEVR